MLVTALEKPEISCPDPTTDSSHLKDTRLLRYKQELVSQNHSFPPESTNVSENLGQLHTTVSCETSSEIAKLLNRLKSPGHPALPAC